MKGLCIDKMQTIRHHPIKFISFDEEELDYDSDRDEKGNADDDCENIECHRVVCKCSKKQEEGHVQPQTVFEMQEQFSNNVEGGQGQPSVSN